MSSALSCGASDWRDGWWPARFTDLEAVGHEVAAPRGKFCAGRGCHSSGMVTLLFPLRDRNEGTVRSFGGSDRFQSVVQAQHDRAIEPQLMVGAEHAAVIAVD